MIDEDKAIFDYQVNRVANIFNSSVKELTQKLLQEFITEESIMTEGDSLERTIYRRFNGTNLQR